MKFDAMYEQDERAGADASTPQTPPDEWKIEDLPTGAQEYIRQLRAEAADRRKALEKAEREAAQREQARLAEEGRWKELAEQRERDLAKVQPYQERAAALESMIIASNKTRMERIPEDMRALVPTEYPPERLAGWLDANFDRLLKRPAPDVDAGAGAGAGNGLPRLSQEQIEMARMMGVSLDAYAKQLAELNKTR